VFIYESLSSSTKLPFLFIFSTPSSGIESNSRLTETQIMSSAAIGPASSREAQPDPDVKTKGNIETYATDIEAENSSDSEHGADKLLTGEEIKEIIPTEAFKWNVDGDQSPCRYLFIPETGIQKSNAPSSPRSGSLCAKHR